MVARAGEPRAARAEGRVAARFNAPRAARVEADANARPLEVNHCAVALDLGELGHAPRWVYQPPLAPSWKTTVFSPLSSTSSK